MAEVILSFIVLIAIVLIMSVGVLMGRKPIKGSCGGMSALGMGTACDVCGGDPKKCEEVTEQESLQENSAEALAYDATNEKNKNHD